VRARLLILSCLWALLAAGALVGCGGKATKGDGGADAAPPGDGASDLTTDAGSDAPPLFLEPFLNVLATPTEYAAMSSVLGAEVKYWVPTKGREAFPPLTAPCTFQNTRVFTWHQRFLMSLPGDEALSYQEYEALVLRQASRRLWAGTLKIWSGPEHPRTHLPGVIAYGLYGQPGSVTADDIRDVDAALKGCVPFAKDLLVFVPDEDQRALLTAAREQLTAEGIASLLPEELAAGAGHLAHSPGEGYGFLRVVPPGQRLETYGPRDVVIVESAPNDISVVAGLISRNPQNELGHVNLRLREKGIPNVTVPRIYDAAWARALEGTLVHLVVTKEQFSLEPATLLAAEGFWEAHRPHVRAPTADLTVQALATFRTLRATDAAAYGPKAANLGELTRVLDPPSRNEGFGIPFARYQQFATSIGIDVEVEAMRKEALLRTDATYKRARLAGLQKRVRAGAFPEPLFAALQAAIAEAFGAAGATQRLRFRSSTNVEDLDTFTGAGLYESKTGCLADDLDGDTAGPSRCLTPAEQAGLTAERAARVAELTAHPERTWLNAIIADLSEDLTEEKPARDAIRKVWASLWEERAFDEREYYGIDHGQAFMGIAVNPSFALEKASAVAVSNLIVDDGAPVYRVSSQVGSESVVRPEDPTSVAEVLTFRREGAQVAQVKIDLPSNRLPAGAAQVWPADELAQLGALLFRVHDHFAANVYPQIVPLHLDFELKHSAEGDVVVKQVRPLSGTGDKDPP
jgi:hypothetical protein